ncbi:MAG: S24 family peptidase, partial [Dehalococcoidia bacterium]|nr:S24 family peptidase [Dehalococcoidia bacterium]
LTPPEKDKGDDPQASLRRVLKEAQRLYEKMAVSEIPLMGNVPCSYDDYQSRGIKSYIPVMLKSLPNLDATHRDLFALMCVGREVKSANISPGDTVIVDQRSTEIIDGKLYLVRVGDLVTIRMMLVTGTPDTYKLLNENMEIEEVSFDDEQLSGGKNRIEIMGRVVLSGGWKVY